VGGFEPAAVNYDPGGAAVVCDASAVDSGYMVHAKHRLRIAFPILIFTLMLTIAYSIFQGNVGTAYRQRTQIQVFLFIFISVGYVLRQEKRENRKLLSQHDPRWNKPRSEVLS